MNIKDFFFKSVGLSRGAFLLEFFSFKLFGKLKNVTI